MQLQCFDEDFAGIGLLNILNTGYNERCKIIQSVSREGVATPVIICIIRVAVIGHVVEKY